MKINVLKLRLVFSVLFLFFFCFVLSLHKACFDARAVDIDEFESDPHTVAGELNISCTYIMCTHIYSKQLKLTIVVKLLFSSSPNICETF